MRACKTFSNTLEMKSCVTKNQKKQSKDPKKDLTSTEDEDSESSSETPNNLKLTTCPLHLFGPPASRVAPLNDEDCMLFKHLLALHRSKQDPALYFKWGIWKTSAELQVPNLEDIVETEVQLITWNKQIQKSSVPGEVAYLRLGLHPDRRCGKLAFQVSFDQAKDFFVQVARIVLQEEISMPMEIHRMLSLQKPLIFSSKIGNQGIESEKRKNKKKKIEY